MDTTLIFKASPIPHIGHREPDPESEAGCLWPSCRCGRGSGRSRRQDGPELARAAASRFESPTHAGQRSSHSRRALVAEAGRWDSNPAPGCFVGQGRSAEWPMTCDSHSPTVTAHAARTQRFPMPCGPSTDQGSRAWKTRPDSPLTPDASPLPQVRWSCGGPLLTVRNRQAPMLQARGEHGRRGPTTLQRGGDGHKPYCG